MLKVMNKAMTMLVKAVIVTMIAGTLAVVLGMVFGLIPEFAGWGAIIVSIIILAIVFYTAKKATIDNLAVFDLVVYLGVLSIVGSVLTLLLGPIFPTIGEFILNVSTPFTPGHLLNLFAVIGLTEAIVLKVLKVK